MSAALGGLLLTMCVSTPELGDNTGGGQSGNSGGGAAAGVAQSAGNGVGGAGTPDASVGDVAGGNGGGAATAGAGPSGGAGRAVENAGASGAPDSGEWYVPSPVEQPCLTKNFQWIDIPAPYYTSGGTLSSDGCIVWINPNADLGASNPPGPPAIFRWTEATGLRRVDPPGTNAQVQVVSRDGSAVAGFTYNAANAPDTSPFLWTVSAGFQPAALPGIPTLMNSDGSVVVGAGAGGSYYWKNGTVQVPVLPLGPTAMNADGQILYGELGAGPTVVRWMPGSALPLASVGNLLPPTHVSADGTVVLVAGYAGSENFFSQVVVWNGTALTPDIAQSMIPDNYLPAAMSDDGLTIVGQTTENGSVPGGPFLVRRNPEQMDSQLTLVTTLLTDEGVDLEGETLIGASGVSADGTVIVGGTQDAGTGHAALKRLWIARISPTGGGDGGSGGGGSGGSATGGTSGATAGSGGGNGSECPAALPIASTVCTTATPNGCYYSGRGCWCNPDAPASDSGFTGHWGCLGADNIACPTNVPTDIASQGTCPDGYVGARCLYGPSMLCMCYSELIAPAGNWICAGSHDCPAIAPTSGAPAPTSGDICEWQDGQCYDDALSGQWRCDN